MAEQSPPTEKDLRTRQWIAGIIVVSALLAFITSLSGGMGAGVTLSIFLSSVIGYAVSLLTLLFLFWIVQAQQRIAESLDKLARREEKGL